MKENNAEFQKILLDILQSLILEEFAIIFQFFNILNTALMY